MEKFVADSIGTPPSNSILSFASYDELNNYYLSNSEQVFAGVAFNINTTVEYSISVDNFDMPNTASLFGSGQSATNLYIDKGTYFDSSFHVLFIFLFLFIILFRLYPIASCY